MLSKIKAKLLGALMCAGVAFVGGFCFNAIIWRIELEESKKEVSMFVATLPSCSLEAWNARFNN